MNDTNASVSPFGPTQAPAALPPAPMPMDSDELAEALAHLESAIAVFDRATTPLNVVELQAKSMLTALRRELRTQQRTRADARPGT